MKIGSYNERRIHLLEMLLLQTLETLSTQLPSSSGMCSSIRESLHHGMKEIDRAEAVDNLAGGGDVAKIRNLIMQNDLVKQGISRNESINYSLDLKTEVSLPEDAVFDYKKAISEIWRYVDTGVANHCDSSNAWRPEIKKLPMVNYTIDPATITSGFYCRSKSYMSDELLLILKVSGAVDSVYVFNLTSRDVATFRYANGENEWVFLAEFLPVAKDAFVQELMKALAATEAWVQEKLERKTFFAMIDPLIEDYFPSKNAEWLKPTGLLPRNSSSGNRFSEISGKFYFEADISRYKITFYLDREHPSDRLHVTRYDNRITWEEVPAGIQHQFLCTITSHLSGEAVKRGLDMQWPDSPVVVTHAMEIFEKALVEYKAFRDEQKKPITLEQDNETE